MNKPKRSAPTPENRDVNGRFVKGNTGNKGGRPRKLPEIKEFCRNESMSGIQKLADLLQAEDTKANDVIAIVRLFLEYGIGKPSAENDRERLDIEKRLADARIAQIEREESEGPQQVEVIISGPAKELGM